MARGFKSLEIGRDIDVEEFAVDEEEAFRVGEAGEARKILRLDFLDTGGANLGHARRFFERDLFRETRLLQFLAERFHRDRGSNSGVEIDENLARLRAFAGT